MAKQTFNLFQGQILWLNLLNLEVLSNVDSWENELSVAHIELVARKSLAAKWEKSNFQGNICPIQRNT